MDVAVPEAGNDGLSGAINDARAMGDLDFVAAADRGDDAGGGYNDGVRERRGIRRGVYFAPDQSECLCVCCDAGASRQAEKEKEKCFAKPIPDHRRGL
jgi:hypothetical protein